MKLIVLISLAVMAFVRASDSNHTICYDYFLQKDGCVSSSELHPCPEKNSTGNPCTSIRAFHYQASVVTESYTIEQYDAYEDTRNTDAPKRLVRRYDTTLPPAAVAGGNGVCGFYNSTITSGVCLWSGTNWLDGSDPNTAGWLNGAETRNCNKQVYIQIQGQPETVQFAPVLDGCNFGTRDPEVGCFQIWVTIDLFEKFNPTPEELSSFTLNSNFTWDFNNNEGTKMANSPF